jgi:hypothetical protein
MLDDRTAMISASGGGASGMPKVLHRILYNAAQMARQRGYEYFEIVSAADASSTGIMVLPGSSTTNASAYCTGAWCNGSATTTSGIGIAMPFVRPGANVMVRFYHGGEVNPTAQGVFSAAAVLSQK